MVNTENKKEGKWHSIICKGKSLKKCVFNDIISLLKERVNLDLFETYLTHLASRITDGNN